MPFSSFWLYLLIGKVPSHGFGVVGKLKVSSTTFIRVSIYGYNDFYIQIFKKRKLVEKAPDKCLTYKIIVSGHDPYIILHQKNELYNSAKKNFSADLCIKKLIFLW